MKFTACSSGFINASYFLAIKCLLVTGLTMKISFRFKVYKPFSFLEIRGYKIFDAGDSKNQAIRYWKNIAE